MGESVEQFAPTEPLACGWRSPGGWHRTAEATLASSAPCETDRSLFERGWSDRLVTRDARFAAVSSPEPGTVARLFGRRAGSRVAGNRLHGHVARACVVALATGPRASRAGQRVAASQADVQAALAELGTSGLVGYDLAQRAYFHRELPFDMPRVPRPPSTAKRSPGIGTCGSRGDGRRRSLGTRPASGLLRAA